MASESEDDKPLASRKPPAKKPVANGTTANGKANGKAPSADSSKKGPAAKVKALDDKSTAVKDASGTPVKAARVKKEYDMPGQTKDTPGENDPLRKFYVSLLEQRPQSEMAKRWCLQYGLLDSAVAEEFMKQIGKKPSAPKSPGKPRASSSESRPAARKPASVKAAPKGDTKGDVKTEPEPATRKRSAPIKYDNSSSEEEDNAPLSKRPAARANGTKAAAAVPASKRQPVKRGRDELFEEGSADDSEDEKPLAARKPAPGKAQAGAAGKAGAGATTASKPAAAVGDSSSKPAGATAPAAVKAEDSGPPPKPQQPDPEASNSHASHTQASTAAAAANGHVPHDKASAGKAQTEPVPSQAEQQQLADTARALTATTTVATVKAQPRPANSEDEDEPMVFKRTGS